MREYQRRLRESYITTLNYLELESIRGGGVNGSIRGFDCIKLYISLELSWLFPALDTKLSFALSSLLAVTTLAVTQAFKTQLAESKSMTIVGGGVGSIFFLFLITAIGNGESLMFGKGFELQFVPEGKATSQQSS